MYQHHLEKEEHSRSQDKGLRDPQFDKQITLVNQQWGDVLAHGFWYKYGQ